MLKFSKYLKLFKIRQKKPQPRRVMKIAIKKMVSYKTYRKLDTNLFQIKKKIFVNYFSMIASYIKL